MRTLWHLVYFHRVRVGYYMGFKTKVRRCETCDIQWEVR